MKITITIATNNDAFSYNKLGEVQELLFKVAKAVKHEITEGKLLDYNGNVVGEFILEEGE